MALAELARRVVGLFEVGDDVIRVADDAEDRVDCSPGQDIAADCETAKR